MNGVDAGYVPEGSTGVASDADIRLAFMELSAVLTKLKSDLADLDEEITDRLAVQKERGVDHVSLSTFRAFQDRLRVISNVPTDT